MDNNFLKNLFQHEFSRMVAVLSKLFGLRHIEIAEDIVSETFLLAAESWAIKGLPENPTAWLYTVAKQKTLYHFRRTRIYDEKVVPELVFSSERTDNNDAVNFSDQNIKDSQLQMIFAICNPAIASEAQIGLALRILCGFGIDEIAEAFLTNKETVNKRLFRAKEKLREEKIEMEMPAEDELPGRLDNVLHVIYLLFSEGYYSKTQNEVLRKDLCLEALRLGLILTEHQTTDLPKTNALLALMCFHASRFNARMTDEQSLVLYERQNEDLWDRGLIKQGMHFLSRSAFGNELTSYHLEARIAHWHCTKDDTREKWEDILQLYNQLLILNYSSSVALNRTYALYKVHGAEAALQEALKLNLESSHFYYILLGELYRNLDTTKAKASFEEAHALAKTQAERDEIQRKIRSL